MDVVAGALPIQTRPPAISAPARHDQYTSSATAADSYASLAQYAVGVYSTKVLIPVAETRAYPVRAEKLLTETQREAVVLELANDPTAGVVIPGTGGLRNSASQCLAGGNAAEHEGSTTSTATACRCTCSPSSRRTNVPISRHPKGHGSSSWSAGT